MCGMRCFIATKTEDRSGGTDVVLPPATAPSGFLSVLTRKHAAVYKIPLLSLLAPESEDGTKCDKVKLGRSKPRRTTIRSRCHGTTFHCRAR